MNAEPTLFDNVVEVFKPFDDMLKKYFNTTGLQDEELKKRELKAGTQNALVLAHFKAFPEPQTPFEVLHALHLNNVPVTSVRRAMTVLTELGYLEKTDIRRQGEFGDMNYCWRLKKFAL